MESREKGGGLLLLLVAIVLALVSAGALALSAASTAQHRLRATERALAQAREALLAYAADRPIDSRVGPGYLPCPDLDDDGWAEATCGSLSGHLGQAERLGRLPWKTLGLPELRDGSGERLWYAVSTRYKGLLNCAASSACVDMTPPNALGTITVRDASGALVHDGTIADPERAASGGAAAVVIAPGAALVRRDGHVQRRDCKAGDCADPRNYLDATREEDNAVFRDRSDAAGRAANGDGFVQGPATAQGALEVNDRLAPISQAGLMARVMARVGIELAHCVRLAPQPAAPQPDAACAAIPALGRVRDESLGTAACSAAPGEGWWAAWRPHVLHAQGGARGLELFDPSGRRIAGGRRFAILVTRRAGACGEGALECDAAGCSRALQPARHAEGRDALVSPP